MWRLVLIIIIYTFIACKEDAQSDESSMNVRVIEEADWTLSFEERTITKKIGFCDSLPSTQCIDVKVTYPKLINGPDTLDVSMDKMVMEYLSDFFASENPPSSDSASDFLFSAIEGYEQTFERDSSFASPLVLEAQIRPIFSNEAISCFENSYSVYTGGAHPNSAAGYFIFENETGRLFASEDLIDKETAFKAELLNALKERHGLDPKADISTAGFFVGDEEFTINDNIGITADSLYITYVPYEVAPYAMGYSSFSFSKDEMESFLFQSFMEKWNK